MIKNIISGLFGLGAGIAVEKKFEKERSANWR